MGSPRDALSEERELVLEEDDDGNWPERTVAILRGDTVHIRHQYYKDERWWTWQDMGCSFPANKVADLLNFVLSG